MNFLDFGLDEKKWKLTTVRTYKSAILQLFPAAVGTTAALKRGIPVDDVVTHGNWSSPAIFEAFYRISRALASNFTTAILS
ncbi:hypothetical protein K457DRAFT_85129 [Linnemannia elongata AG-77]|uniref:Uncharacterized protein n=1 Tax=Linnemannia elongata AG-77 TaxID=1314771 RepID=A0A197JAS9_9FUNG|nr:hypothetical protein K457DRAFT_85129 [Linnemannia elongata AG-77]